MSSLALTRRRAFSLIELVIVVVIIGIVAAIAIPRMSRGAAGANDSALTGNLAVLRKAIDLYAAEHGGSFPADATAFVTALTSKTNADGTTTGTPIYGPYIRVIPPMTAGNPTTKNSNAVSTTAGNTGGWLYDATAGTVKANLDATDVKNKDAAGMFYNTY